MWSERMKQKKCIKKRSRRIKSFKQRKRETLQSAKSSLFAIQCDVSHSLAQFPSCLPILLMNVILDVCLLFRLECISMWKSGIAQEINLGNFLTHAQAVPVTYSSQNSKFLQILSHMIPVHLTLTRQKWRMQQISRHRHNTAVRIFLVISSGVISHICLRDDPKRI